MGRSNVMASPASPVYVYPGHGKPKRLRASRLETPSNCLRVRSARILQAADGLFSPSRRGLPAIAGCITSFATPTACVLPDPTA